MSIFKNDIKEHIKSWFKLKRKPSTTTDTMSPALDWRSLSPDRPPLPFFNINDTAIKDDNKKLKRTSEPLLPILEESETMITESIHSSQPSPTEPIPVVVEKDKYIPQDLIGNEKLCRRKFAKMVLAAYKYQQESQPAQMNLIFNEQGNIDKMCLIKQTEKGPVSELHQFVGNSQYVPPEIATQTIDYHSEMADVWVLGIFLYRMLIGKYPFSATNDKQLFTKMLHADFTIPSHLSSDAKDLIRRMLAPDASRASLDLIIHHPWLLSYRHLLLEQSPPQIQPTTNRTQYKAKKGLFKKAIKFIVYGPFPPPKQPYQDLSHLGTRHSVFHISTVTPTV